MIPKGRLSWKLRPVIPTGQLSWKLRPVIPTRQLSWQLSHVDPNRAVVLEVKAPVHFRVQSCANAGCLIKGVCVLCCLVFTQCLVEMLSVGEFFLSSNEDSAALVALLFLCWSQDERVIADAAPFVR